jgi:hypothetical protein
LPLMVSSKGPAAPHAAAGSTTTFLTLPPSAQRGRVIARATSRPHAEN